MTKTLSVAALALLAALAGCGGGTATNNANAKNGNAVAANRPAVNANSARTSVVPPPPGGPGQSFRDEAAGVQFDAPAGWKTDNKGQYVQITAPDDSLTIMVMTAEESTLEQTTSRLDDELAKVMKNIKSEGEPQQQVVNGLPVTYQEGTGDVDGRPADWGVYLLQGRKPVLILSFANHGAFDARRPEVDQFVGSIRRI